jgi:hypothetical protein
MKTTAIQKNTQGPSLEKRSPFGKKKNNADESASLETESDDDKKSEKVERNPFGAKKKTGSGLKIKSPDELAESDDTADATEDDGSSEAEDQVNRNPFGKKEKYA